MRKISFCFQAQNNIKELQQGEASNYRVRMSLEYVGLIPQFHLLNCYKWIEWYKYNAHQK